MADTDSAGYPPSAYRVEGPTAAVELMRAHPFAHVFTAVDGLRATRVPVVVDLEEGRPVQLRAHLDARNPQARGLHGAPVLVTFSGAAAYVSPHWRADKSKGGTYDYEEVQVRGKARVVAGIHFFEQLIDDLSALIEPQHAEIADCPVWRTTMAPAGHIERQVSLVTLFVVDVGEVVAISKLHQNFPEADRRSVAEHLCRSHRDDVRALAAKMRQLIGPA
jgi:transcriptional regulator